MRVLCDLDSIIVDLQTSWLALYNKDYNDNLTTANILEWETHKYVKPECGQKIYDYLSKPGFFYNLEPLHGATEALERLHESGLFNIRIITAAPLGTFEEKREWVHKWLPFLDPKKDIIACYDKYLVNGDILIDDSPHNIVDYKKTHFYAKICTIAYPYNKCVEHLTNVYAEDYSTPVDAWQQIYTYIFGLKK